MIKQLTVIKFDRKKTKLSKYVFCLNLFKSDTLFGQSFFFIPRSPAERRWDQLDYQHHQPGNYVFNRQVNYIRRMIEILVLCEV